MVNKKVNLKNVKIWATNFCVNTQTFSAYILKLTGFHMENFFLFNLTYFTTAKR